MAADRRPQSDLSLSQPCCDQLRVMHPRLPRIRNTFLLLSAISRPREADDEQPYSSLLHESKRTKPWLLIAETIDNPYRRIAASIRRLTRWRITAKPMTIFKNCRLVTPVNRRTFRLCAGNHRIGPFSHCSILIGFCSSARFMGQPRVYPHRKRVFAHRPNWHVDLKEHLDHLHHVLRIASRQAELFRILANDNRAQLPLLVKVSVSPGKITIDHVSSTSGQQSLPIETTF